MGVPSPIRVPPNKSIYSALTDGPERPVHWPNRIRTIPHHRGGILYWTSVGRHVLVDHHRCAVDTNPTFAGIVHDSQNEHAALRVIGPLHTLPPLGPTAHRPCPLTHHRVFHRRTTNSTPPYSVASVQAEGFDALPAVVLPSCRQAPPTPPHPFWSLSVE